MFELIAYGYAGYTQSYFPTLAEANREAAHLVNRWGFVRANIEIREVE